MHNDLADVIRSVRIAASLTQRELADRAGVSAAMIRDIEQRRTSRPYATSIRQLARALNLSESDLRELAAVRADAAGGAPLDIGVLGPLSIRRHGRTIEFGSAMQRTILSRLALDPHVAARRDELIEILWPGDQPGNPDAVLHTYVSRIRAALRPRGGGPSPVSSVAGVGYRLDIDTDHLDLTRFRQLAEQARRRVDTAALDLFEQAHRLWRGKPIPEVAALHGHPLLSALRDERAAEVLRFARLAERTGEQARALPLLRGLAEDEPLNEPVHAHLITALAAGGQRAAALAAHDAIRRRLGDELGIEPGADLAQAHARVLRQETARPVATVLRHTGETAATVRPSQLPLDVRGFVGRADALAALDRHADSVATSPTVVVVALSGTAGVGKTTLAVHWAHRARCRFPDGQLYVNLRGFHPAGPPLQPGVALQQFLTALGVAPHLVPSDVDAQAALYRTLLVDRRVLVVLDNASDPDQIRPLLPASPHCLALVTSRNGLAGLVAAEAAQPMRVDVLDADEARELLMRRLGRTRLAGDVAAADRIADYCARLPLALAIAAARAAETPSTPLASLADQLSERAARLETLSTGEPGTDLRTVFRWSYRMLRPSAAALFRLLGLHSGADISAAAAADLAGLPSRRTAPLLAELTRANLLSETVPGRYTFHDLLHAYAADRTDAEDSLETRRDAAIRLFDHYLRNAKAAIHLLYPGEHNVGRLPHDAIAAFPNARAARAWLDADRANLVSAAGNRPGSDWSARTAALAEALRPYFDSGYYADGLILHTLARKAAQAQGDHRAEATALNHLGALNRRGGRIREAGDQHREALALARRVNDGSAIARSLRELGIVYWRLGDYDRARHHHQAALDHYRDIGDRHGEALQLNFFGIGFRQAGDHRRAVTYQRTALAIVRAVGHRVAEADVLDTLGVTFQHTGKYRLALACHQRALAVFHEWNHRLGEANALHNLGCVFHALDLPADAVSHHQRALSTYRDIGERCFEVEGLNGLAAAQTANGEPAAALDTYAAALEMAATNGDQHEAAKAHGGIAGIGHAAGNIDAASYHWQQAHAIYSHLGLPQAERIGHRLRNLTGGGSPPANPLAG